MSVKKYLVYPMIVCLLLASLFSVGMVQASASALPLVYVGAQACDNVNGSCALRFCFTLTAQGVTADEEGNAVIADGATVCIDGTEYPLVDFGAKVGPDKSQLPSEGGVNVPARKLYSVNDDGTVTYTARVTDLTTADEDHRDTVIYACGYVQYLDGDNVVTLYTDVAERCYDDVYSHPDFPQVGGTPHKYLQITKVKLRKESGTITLTIKNTSGSMESEQTSYLQYTCYNASGRSLGNVKVNIGRIHAGKEVTCTVTLKTGTEKMTFLRFMGEFWTDGFH